MANESVWRLVTSFDEPPADTPQPLRGALNMAIDRALLESVRAGAPPVLRFYRWRPACLSLGRHQAAEIDLEALARAGHDLVRRPTGGLAVLHDRELTYALVVRAGVIGSPRAVYERVNRGLLRGLAALGATALSSATEDTSAGAFRKGGSCFASAAPGELVNAGRKLIGSAQRCEKHTILQHGSILLAGDQALALRALREAEISPQSTTLEELLGHVPDWPVLTRAFAAGLSEELGIALARATLSAAERERALELVEADQCGYARVGSALF